VSATAFALAVAAAALHAVWNVLLAGARDVRAATVVALAIGVVVFAPVTLATWEVEAAAVPWLAASAGFETLYFFLLTAAYRRSDLSLVYPIARGAAPVLVLLALREAPAPAVAAVRETSILFAVALGAIVLRERITAARVAGAAVIVAGVAFVALL
jgi:drug/metabolite transporter (DMT)-like permease